MLIELFAAAALGHQGTDRPAPPPAISNPSWSAAPSPSWPRGGSQMNINSAEVETSCIASPEGRITDCRIDSETPSGYGFAREVLASTSAARLDTSAEGFTVGAPVRFTVHFDHQNIRIATRLDDE